MNIKSNVIKAEVVKVTPALAKRWLASMQCNRLLRQTRVEQYAADMRAGRWQLNGESIKFDVGGHLLNGQHRLNAVLASGCSVEMLIVVGLPSESQKTMDTGLKAKSYDWADIPNAAQSHAICSAIGKMWAPNIARGFSRGEVDAIYEAVGPDLIQHVCLAMRGGLANRAALRAGCVLIHRVESGGTFGGGLSPRAAEWADRIVSMSAPATSPECALFKAFGVGQKSRKGFHAHQLRAMVLRAVVAALRGEEMKLVRGVSDEQCTWFFEQARIVFPDGLGPSNANGAV